MFRVLKSKISLLLFLCKNKNRVRVSFKSEIYNVIVEGKNSIADDVKLSNCKIGYGSYINKCTILSYVKIGRFCSIADHVSVCRGNHPVHFVTTHPAFYYDTSSQIGYTFHKGTPLFSDIYKFPPGEDYYQVIIGNDVWIGSHAIIMGGCCIGDGAVIAAGSVVTKDIEPYTIVGGVPARVIRKRFSKEIIDKLLITKWWDRPISDIESNYEIYTDVSSFLNTK